LSRIVLIGFTPLSWAGGVNSWCRSFIQRFPGTVHFSFWDVPGHERVRATEDQKAVLLCRYLHRTGKITPDDIIIGDGFWTGDLLDCGYKKIVSVSHGIWGHVTLDDIKAGKQPENVHLHKAQTFHRVRNQKKGGRNVAVSDFIAHEMKRQYDVDSHVINTGVDLDDWQPLERSKKLDMRQHVTKKPLIVHGVNDPSNHNKGWEHVQAVKKDLGDDVEIMSLDEMRDEFGDGFDPGWPLNIAQFALIPSGFEGNSVFTAECLACDLPVVAYGVGLMWRALQEDAPIGVLAPHSLRSTEMTVSMVRRQLFGDF
jgi:glycosyltransferase involved in cell wall biosynthesis